MKKKDRADIFSFKNVVNFFPKKTTTTSVRVKKVFAIKLQF